jgi:hypothetical protein
MILVVLIITITYLLKSYNGISLVVQYLRNYFLNILARI